MYIIPIPYKNLLMIPYRYHSIDNMFMFVFMFRFRFYSKLKSTQKRVFHDTTLQTVGNLTSAPEIGTHSLN